MELKDATSREEKSQLRSLIQSCRDIKCRYIYQQAAAGLASQVRTKTGEPLSGGPPFSVKTTRNSISISSNLASSNIPPRPTPPTSLSLRLPNSSSQELRRWGCCREQGCRHLELHSSLPALALEGDIIPQGAGPPPPQYGHSRALPLLALKRVL